MWIQTATGGQFFYDRLEDNEINVVDIAVSLGNKCRFNGHYTSGTTYSIAEHSILMAREALLSCHGLTVAYQCLHHDDVEAYLVDMTSPLKALFPEYKALEKKVERVIFERLGVPTPLSPVVKRYDTRILKAEYNAMMVTSILSGNDNGIITKAT